MCMYPNALISGHPGGGVTPGTYGGIARDLPSFVANNFWPGTGYWNAFALPRQDTWGKTCGICNIVAILKMKDLDRGDRVNIQVLLPWTLREDFENKIKENKNCFNSK